MDYLAALFNGLILTRAKDNYNFSEKYFQKCCKLSKSMFLNNYSFFISQIYYFEIIIF